MTSFRILLITPPLTQLNTPYPATAYIKGFLGGRGYTVAQADLGLELVLRMFSAAGLKRIFQEIEQNGYDLSDNARRMVRLQRSYITTIEPVVRFLQNKDNTLAPRICHSRFLPEAARFDNVADLETAFGTMGLTDQARHLATLYLEDLGDLIKETVGPQFGFSRYAEKLALSATSFEPLYEALQTAPNLVDRMLLELLDELVEQVQPDVVGFTVPFPGNLYGALRLAGRVKALRPQAKTLMGGGYPNTELRQIKEPRFFDYVDYLTLDDGEGPWLRLLEHLQEQRPQSELQRTFLRDAEGQIQYLNYAHPDIPHPEVGTPDYSNLPLTEYLSVIEVLNPMHRLWSDGRWNKLTIAHDCYWKRCSFCDVTLDYIGRYETAPATLLVDRIEQIVQQTGQTGFHFVDEAAPPLALRDLAIELLKRRVSITWWGNIRFEKTFSPDLCRRWLHCRVGRARSCLRSFACPDGERCNHCPSSARDGWLHPSGHHGTRLPHVWFSHANNPGNHRLAGSSTATIRGGHCAVGLLAPLLHDSALASGQEPGEVQRSSRGPTARRLCLERPLA